MRNRGGYVSVFALAVAGLAQLGLELDQLTARIEQMDAGHSTHGDKERGLPATHCHSGSVR